MNALELRDALSKVIDLGWGHLPVTGLGCGYPPCQGEDCAIVDISIDTAQITHGVLRGEFRRGIRLLTDDPES